MPTLLYIAYLIIAFLYQAGISHSFHSVIHPGRFQRPFTSHSASTVDVTSNVRNDNSILNFPSVQRLTLEALNRRGTSAGYKALDKLKKACQLRKPYDFEANKDLQPNVRYCPKLIPSDVTRRISSIVKEMESQGLLSTNLDSVDGLPSFHLNLVSARKPLFPKGDASGGAISPLGLMVQDLLDLVEPYIYEKLLPQVREVCQSDRIQVEDIFLRRYGQDSDDARNGISAHYDVFSRVTSVIAMDDTGADGNNGLFTMTCSPNDDDNKSSKKMSTVSSHASLREYFPLNEGDGVIHTWDVLHGVDVFPGSDRTSLIIWFAEHAERKGDIELLPWLIRDKVRTETDDITQFVLASAIASTCENYSETDQQDKNEEISPSQSHRSRSKMSLQSLNQHELYLKSASRGNAFALACVGSICAEKAWTKPYLELQAQALLQELEIANNFPTLLSNAYVDDSQRMAWQFWWESSLRGNPNAQFALADDLMAYALPNNDGKQQDFLLLATVLFGLAAQQGVNDAMDRLSDVVSLSISKDGIETEEDFFSSRVVQTAQAAVS